MIAEITFSILLVGASTIFVREFRKAWRGGKE